MKYAERDADIIVADSLPQLNYKQKKLLLASRKKDNADRGKYAAALIKIVGESVYNSVERQFPDPSYREKVLTELDKCGVECITVKSESYPALLKQIPVPPLVLYAKGNTSLLGGRMFGIVGSRKTTGAMLEECKKISAELSKSLVVVTGVADGADKAAASGAVSSGNVICVLPGGHMSPCTGDIKTYKLVERNGLTISEFPPHIPAQRYTFLLRNRIIAGMSEGVLVVSAARRSGALNTASYAADYSRDVFAFPYAPGISSGEGCNALIKKGANLCDCAEDILSALGLESAKEEEEALTEEEREVLSLLKTEGELHLEKIAALLNKKLFEISALCASLEIKGAAAAVGGNKYAAI